jgi:hypothetical protein
LHEFKHDGYRLIVQREAHMPLPPGFSREQIGLAWIDRLGMVLCPTTKVIPTMSRLRRSLSPILVMSPSRSLPPLDWNAASQKARDLFHRPKNS